MSDNEIDSVIEELADVEKIKEKERRVLAQLLDKEIRQEKRYICIRGNMGISLTESGKSISVPSYSCMHTLEWVGRKNILMGSEMDFLKNKINKETNKLEIDEESAEMLRQRAPDWSRQVDLAAYLIQENAHKFGTILAVLSPSWVDNLNHENWGRDGRALVSASAFEALDSEGNIGLLNLNGTEVYALDGQHRVMGVRGLIDVLEGGITAKTKEQKETNRRFTKEDFLALLRADVTKLRMLLEEKINVEYIPAVMVGETRTEATQRIRKVFNAINNQAKALDKGENILLDENHGASIVARRIGHHAMFVNLESKSRVNWKNSAISSGESNDIITLQHLKDCVLKYVANCTKLKWEADFNTVPFRPSDDELDGVEFKVKELLDNFSKLPTYKSIAAGDDLVELREFPNEEQPGRKGNLLVRPIGLPILMNAITNLIAENVQDVTALFKKLRKFDSQNGFEVCQPKSPFYMVTYDSTKNKMIVKQGNLQLAAEIIVYLLNGGKAEVRENLLERIVKARSISPEEWIDYSGKAAPIDMSRIELSFEPIRA